MNENEIPYDELDSNIVSLVILLNDFPGITTIGSCGGHKEPERDQCPEGNFWVKFGVAKNENGWFALEFLAWLINEDMRDSNMNIILFPVAPPPYMNDPGQVLSFVIEGRNLDPLEVGSFIKKIKRQYYISPDEVTK